MATTNIIPFAAFATNILSDAEYSADVGRTLGHVPGVARSVLENKALKQASIIAAGVAQFLADKQATNVADSLTAQNIADMLAVSVASMIAGVPDASTTVKGIVELATTGETQTGTDAVRAVTPAGLAARTATTTRAGVVELATAAEVNTGSLTTHAVTPQGLDQRTATEARTGIVELATVAEVQAGTDTARAVTPAGLFALDKSLLTNGYAKLPGGLIVQWGQDSSGGNPTITFPIPFPTAALTLQCINDSTRDVRLTSLTATTFRIDAEGAGVNFWLALGY